LEQKLDVAREVIDAFDRIGAVVCRFGEDEGALQHGLCVAGEAGRRPAALDAPCLHRCRNVGFERGSVAVDASCASVADGRGARVDLLHHGAD
jgi:hypothetical protein